MILNALTFNKTGDGYWREAQRCYIEGCTVFNQANRRSTISAFGLEIKGLLDKFAATGDTSSNTTNGGKGRGKKAAKVATFSTIISSSSAVSSSAVSGDASGGEIVDKRAKAKAEAVYAYNRTYTHKRKSVDAVATTTEIATTANDTKRSRGQSSSPTIEIPAPAKTTPAPSLVSGVDAGTETVAVDDGELVITLPTKLTPSTDPATFINYAVCLLSTEDAYYRSQIDQCFVCGSADQVNHFLFCIDCGEAFHSFCVDAPMSTMGPQERSSWRCTNCKVCECCATATESDSASLVFCEICDRSYHMSCLTPPCTELPTNLWICHHCTRCKICSSIPSSTSPTNDSSAVSADSDNSTAVISSSASSSTEDPIPLVWGLCVDVCIRCVESEKQRLTREHHNRQNELNRAQANMNEAAKQIKICNMCHKYNPLVDDTAKVYCEGCSHYYHMQCLPAVLISSWLPQYAKGFRCSGCLQGFTDLYAVDSSLLTDPLQQPPAPDMLTGSGTGTVTSPWALTHIGPLTKQVGSILTKVAAIQRATLKTKAKLNMEQLNAKTVVYNQESAGLHKLLCRVSHHTHFNFLYLLYQYVIICAVLAMLAMARLSCSGPSHASLTSDPTKRLSTSTSVRPRLWTKITA